MITHDVVDIKNTTSRSNRKQVKESKNDNVVTKYKLEKYTPFNHLKQLSQCDYQLVVDQEINEYFNNFNTNLYPIPENRESLWNFVKNDVTIHTHFRNKINDDTSKLDQDKIGALIIRIKRFRLKYFTVILMRDWLINFGENPVKALEEKLSYIEKELMRKSVIIKFTESTTEIKVTIASTISLINKSLIEFENILKQVVPSLLQMYKLPLEYADGKTFNSFREPQIVNALKGIAVDGLTGGTKDYHYIIQLLLDENYGKFNQDQRKQIDTYVKELNLIYTFFLLKANTNSPTTIDLISLMDSTISINIPFNKFISSETCSGNTFGRIINALNKFVTSSWVSVLIHIGDYNNSLLPKPGTDPTLK